MKNMKYEVGDKIRARGLKEPKVGGGARHDMIHSGEFAGYAAIIKSEHGFFMVIDPDTIELVEVKK